MSAKISDVTQAATQTGDASGQMLPAAKNLSQQGETLRSEVTTFFGRAKAA